MSEKLSYNFINELFRLVFLKKDINSIVKQFVEYNHIPDEWRQYKKILKSVKNNNSEDLISFGVVSQQHINDIDVQEALTKIKEADIVSKDQLLGQLESFVKHQEFKLLSENVASLYKEGKKDEAIEYQAKKSNEIVNFSLKKEANRFLKLYGDFHQVQKERQIKQEEEGNKVYEKVPFSIDILDDITYGGIDKTDTVLWIMRSGVGKSTVLRYTGMNACRLGYNVLHIQLEGSRDEVFNKYSQMWTKIPFHDLKKGDIPAARLSLINKKIKEMEAMGNEMFIYAFEKFEHVSMTEIRELIVEYNKINGFLPDLIIIDYLQLLITGENKDLDNNPAYEKKRLNRVAELMKNIAVEFDTRILTAAQTSDVPFQQWNDPDFVITRSNTEADRTIAKSFSYIFTGNQTVEEDKNNIMRVYIDKLRNYKTKTPIVKIRTAYDKGKFYDRLKTMKMYEENEKL
jgi:replicative DNA helicase